MTTLELWHGSHTKGIESIQPNERGLQKIFGSSSIVVAAFFTAHPNKYSFLVDTINKRVYLPDDLGITKNDNGGSIYKVVGDFKPASDKLIFEFEAEKAMVIEETEIDSAFDFVSRLGFLIYTDTTVHNWAYFYQQDHKGYYPKDIPEGVQPLIK
jgi:hypothetical protein